MGFLSKESAGVAGSGVNETVGGSLLFISILNLFLSCCAILEVIALVRKEESTGLDSDEVSFFNFYGMFSSVLLSISGVGFQFIQKIMNYEYCNILWLFFLNESSAVWL